MISINSRGTGSDSVAAYLLIVYGIVLLVILYVSRKLSLRQEIICDYLVKSMHLPGALVPLPLGALASISFRFEGHGLE
jgi:hypothetical protein